MQPHIPEARFYPVKSCKPQRLGEGKLVEVTEKGIRGDREFMVTDADGDFKTQRSRHGEFTRLCLVQPERTEKYLILSAEGMPRIDIPIDPWNREMMDVKIWDDTVRAMIYAEGSRWMSEFIGKPCRLVRQDGERKIDRAYAPEDAKVSFADRNQIHAMSVETAAAINTEIERFRPNLLMLGLGDRGENNIIRMRIGTAEFQRTIPCERCEAPANAPLTGKFNKDVLELLREQRKPHASKPPILGEQFLVTVPGSFRAGDAAEIEILESDATGNGWSREFESSPRRKK